MKFHEISNDNYHEIHINGSASRIYSDEVNEIFKFKLRTNSRKSFNAKEKQHTFLLTGTDGFATGLKNDSNLFR